MRDIVLDPPLERRAIVVGGSISGLFAANRMGRSKRRWPASTRRAAMPICAWSSGVAS
jgi:hypothetical protein